jgi:hypothetical protein
MGLTSLPASRESRYRVCHLEAHLALSCGPYALDDQSLPLGCVQVVIRKAIPDALYKVGAAVGVHARS